MNYIILLLFLLVGLNLILFYINNKNKKLNQNNYIDKNNSSIKEIDNKLINKQKEYKLEVEKLEGQKRTIENDLSSLNRIIKQSREQWESEYKTHQLTLSARLQDWENSQKALLDERLKTEQTLKENKLNKEYNDYLYFIEANKANLQEKLEEIKAEIDEYQSKRNTINEEIRRQRAVEEQQDFYRIQLSEEAKEDIRLISSIRYNLHFRQNLDKLVYDNYIAKPTNEMIKRVLGGSAPSGIYKITRLKTGEIYIGKSTDIKSRWQQHAKSAFNVGTIAHSILHTTMEKDGIENFTWELLEEVPKDELGAREKFYINFYNTKKYGLNEKEGG